MLGKEDNAILYLKWPNRQQNNILAPFQTQTEVLYPTVETCTA